MKDPIFHGLWMLFAATFCAGVVMGTLLTKWTFEESLTACQAANGDQAFRSVAETAQSCLAELRDVRRTLEATQKVCRDEKIAKEQGDNGK